jgi:hypothetical protein
MKHNFKHICYDAPKLLKGCNKLSTFMTRLTKQSTEKLHYFDSETYKGMGFEAFVEVLISLSPIDKRVGIVDYRPWDGKVDGPDMGIDGLGKTHSGDVACVQVKFRSNVDADLTANKDHISNFVAMSKTKYSGQNIDMVIFTTASDLNQTIKESMYHDQVRTIGFNELKKFVDDNIPFWDTFRKEMGA